MEQELFSKELMDTPLDDTNALYHWGVKGMKWGVRRYANKDGSLTDAGKKRYDRDQRGNKNKGKGNKIGQADPNRWVREDMERTRTLANESRNMTGNLKTIVDKSIKNTPKQTMDLSNMTDKELRDQINRAFLEKQYNDMFAPQKSTKGREYAARTLEVAGDVFAVTSSALAIALAIQQLTRG